MAIETFGMKRVSERFFKTIRNTVRWNHLDGSVSVYNLYGNRRFYIFTSNCMFRLEFRILAQPYIMLNVYRSTLWAGLHSLYVHWIEYNVQLRNRDNRLFFNYFALIKKKKKKCLHCVDDCEDSVWLLFLIQL